jgi:glycosyltransferase involved in cell wall biosynthesis
LTIKRVLGLGTYPIAKPIHGGQRRVAAIKNYYRTIGIEYIYACIYDGGHYRPPHVGPMDIPVVKSTLDVGPISLVGDVVAGHQAETDPATLAHFVKLVEQTNPDALQLEQPFMWPLARRLRQRLGAARLPVIYSSHNIEAPLKQEIFLASRATPEASRRIHDLVAETETDLSRSAALTVCVSAADRDRHLAFGSATVIVVPNGVDRPPATTPRDTTIRSIFGDNRFVFVAGSAYTPNVDGFCACVAKDGIFISPPSPSIAVCGGVARGIVAHPAYNRFAASNGSRVRFFPEIEDDELWAVKNACHAAMLPILSGGGSNLKTAEALALGKWVVATPKALRGFESFTNADGVILADARRSFGRALAHVLRMPPLRISDVARKARDDLYWDRVFATSTLSEELARL